MKLIAKILLGPLLLAYEECRELFKDARQKTFTDWLLTWLMCLILLTLTAFLWFAVIAFFMWANVYACIGVAVILLPPLCARAVCMCYSKWKKVNGEHQAVYNHCLWDVDKSLFKVIYKIKRCGDGSCTKWLPYWKLSSPKKKDYPDNDPDEHLGCLIKRDDVVYRCVKWLGYDMYAYVSLVGNKYIEIPIT